MFDESSVEFAKLFLVYGSRKETGLHKLGKSIKKTVKKIPKALKIPVPEFNNMPPVPIAPGAEPISSPKIESKPDLGQIQNLVDDFSVTMIQCDGPDTPLKITRDQQTTETDISLSTEEINNILTYFSKQSNQPVVEPVFQVQIGTLKIMAIVSSYAGSRFIISRQ